MSFRGSSAMASTVALHCPGRKGVFIRGIIVKGASGMTRSGGGAAGSCLLRRRSSGLAAFAGIAQDFPNFCAPGIRPWVHSCCTVRGASPHFSAACRAVRDSMISPPVRKFPVSIICAMAHGCKAWGWPFASAQAATISRFAPGSGGTCRKRSAIFLILRRPLYSLQWRRF